MELDPLEGSVAFTGTRRGLTLEQVDSIWGLLFDARRTYRGRLTLRMGDCVGADAQFHNLARVMGGFFLIGHPPVNPAYRAFLEYNVEVEPEEYLVRNRAMVDRSSRLIAAPGGSAEALRSGTWSTVRYARKLGRPVYLVLPSGEVRW